MSVERAASTSRRALLEAMRDTIASQIDDGVAARDLAALTRRLLEISEELEVVVADEEGDDIGKAASVPARSWAPSGGAQSSPS